MTEPIVIQHKTYRGVKTYHVYGGRVACQCISASGKPYETDLTCDSQIKRDILAKAKRRRA
jgi:hypothetical protein